MMMSGRLRGATTTTLAAASRTLPLFSCLCCSPFSTRGKPLILNNLSSVSLKGIAKPLFPGLTHPCACVAAHVHIHARRYVGRLQRRMGDIAFHLAFVHAHTRIYAHLLLHKPQLIAPVYALVRATEQGLGGAGVPREERGVGHAYAIK